MTEQVFVDTSALYAYVDADDPMHAHALTRWGALLDAVDARRVEPVTHHGVVIETSALVQRRLGLPVLREVHTALLPAVSCHWIDEDLHRRALSALLAAGRRDVSLVDWTSFELMRDLGIDRALAFDGDFADQGFEAWE